MYLITMDGKENEGAYAAVNEDGDYVLYIFTEEDDAIRFAMLLEEEDYPKMNVMEVEENLIKRACDLHGYEYKIFTEDDIVIPPITENTEFI